MFQNVRKLCPEKSLNQREQKTLIFQRQLNVTVDTKVWVVLFRESYLARKLFFNKVSIHVPMSSVLEMNLFDHIERVERSM